jgi:Rieske 2Fe-2S family protein
VHPELCDIVPAFRRNGGSDLDWERGIPHREGAYTFTGTGTTARAPFPDLNEDERTRHFGEVLYPNLFLSLSCDHVAAFMLQPKGPDRTLIECQFLFAPEEIASAGFDPSDAVELLGHHQSPGLGDLRERATWNRRPPARSRLLRADGGL